MLKKTICTIKNEMKTQQLVC